MTPFDFASKLRECELLPTLSPESLSQFWGLGQSHFLVASETSPIQFFGLGDESSTSVLLRGAQFFVSASKAEKHKIFRSHPRIFSTSDHTSIRHQILLEQTVFDLLLSGVGNAIVEPKIPGQTIRVYSHNGDLYCASDVSFDGGNPLVGAGIENSNSLGTDYGHQAARLVSERYPKIDRLAKLGYVGVFVLFFPETAHGSDMDRADLIMIDVIDPDHQFVDRIEKERIAEDFSLNVVPLASRLKLPDSAQSPESFVRLCRGLSRQAHQDDFAGYILKIQADEISDHAFIKIESASERDNWAEISSSDFSAVVAEISGQYGDTIWTDMRMAEEIMLEFLGSHRPATIREVHRFLSSWQQARTSAGLV